MINNSSYGGLSISKRGINNWICLFFMFFAPLYLFAQNIPEPSNSLVTDYTHTLSNQQAASLEHKLVAFSDSTSTQIAVVIISSLEGSDIASYGQQLGQKWGIGSKKNNNGVLLLISKGDRKVTIQTGYGVEGALPDALARRIIEREIKPNFKAGNYYAGIDRGTDAIIACVKGEYKAQPKQTKGNRGLFFIILIVLVIIIISRINKGGGNSQVIGGNGGASPFWWMLLGSALNSGGRNSGWGGSGGGSGGFGGFGGGGFGGGGASGDW